MILVAGITGLLVTFVIQTRYLVPVENELVAQDVKFITDRIDSLIKLRSFLVISAAGKGNLETFLEKGGLEKLSASIRESFPDFLSLEVVNDRGEVLGMIGDLNLQPLNTKTRGGTFIQLSTAINFYNSVFSDDPAAKSFMITCRHFAADRGIWYSRCRFARDEIEALLSSFKNEKVSLVPIWGGGINPGMLENFTNHTQEPVLNGTPWSSVEKGEMLLQSPGWMVRVEKNRGGVLSPTTIVTSLAILACLCALPILKRIWQFFAAVREGLSAKNRSYASDTVKVPVHAANPDSPERHPAPQAGHAAGIRTPKHDLPLERRNGVPAAAKETEKTSEPPQVVFIQDTDDGGKAKEKSGAPVVDFSETVEIMHSELLSPIVIVEEDERQNTGEAIAAGEAAQEQRSGFSEDFSVEPAADSSATKALNDEDADKCYATCCDTDAPEDCNRVFGAEITVSDSAQQAALLLLPPGKSAEAEMKTVPSDLPDTLELIWDEPAEADSEKENHPQDSVRFSEFFTC